MHCPYCGREMAYMNRYSSGERQTTFLGTVYVCVKCDKMFDQAAYRYVSGVARPIPITTVKWEESEMKWSEYKKKNPKERLIKPGKQSAKRRPFKNRNLTRKTASKSSYFKEFPDASDFYQM